MGVVFITHDLGLVADIADTILVLYKGQIVEQGKTKEVLQHPKQPYTKALLACRPALHNRGAKLPVVSDFLESNENNHTMPTKPVITSEINEVTAPKCACNSLSSKHFIEYKGSSEMAVLSDNNPSCILFRRTLILAS